MQLVPLDWELLLMTAVIVPVFVEFLKNFLAYLFGRASDKYLKLKKDLFVKNEEKKGIKSMQQEFVRHSKLERDIIAIEKQIDAITANEGPKSEKINFILRTFRCLIYIGVSVHFASAEIILVEPRLVWPMFFLSRTYEPQSMNAWQIVLISAVSWRYIMKTTLSILFPPAPERKK